MDKFEEYLNKKDEYEIIDRALTDNSYKKVCQDEAILDFNGITNKQLATYGDAVIKLAYCIILLDKVEKLTVEKAKYESDEFFVDFIGRKYDILKYLKFNKNDDKILQKYNHKEGKSKNHNRTKYIATAVEAMMGAIYQLEGIDTIKKILISWLEEFQKEDSKWNINDLK